MIFSLCEMPHVYASRPVGEGFGALGAKVVVLQRIFFLDLRDRLPGIFENEVIL